MRKRMNYRKRRVVALLMTFIMAFTFYGGASSVFAAGGDAPQADGNLNIKSVEVLNHADIQKIYRQSVYKGVSENGEDPDKWYTTKRGINLNDERAFTFEFTVTEAQVGEDPDSFLDSVKLQYGGYDLEQWANPKGARGKANALRKEKDSDVPYLIAKDKSIKQNPNGSYTVTMVMETACPWEGKYTYGSSSLEYGDTNIPYEGYNANRQLYAFSDGQSADNRWWWQTTPTHKGLGTYAMTAVAGDSTLASVDMDIQQYDGGNSWIQKNEFAQSLIKAINGTEVPKSAFADKEIGLMASGYVAMNKNGGFVKGERNDSVYVEVSILGYGLTDNELPENKDFNNYSRYNPIWNIVVALDEDKVDTYLNETKPTMNDDPENLINKYKNMPGKDIDMINVFYQTNVHADEISGIDHTIQFVKDLIDGGKAGKKIDYYTWNDDDMNFRYRDPAEGYEESTDGHVVKGGYEGRFKDTSARTKQVFDTREALDSFIMVNNITTNPDGQAGMRRTNRYAFDLNRDAVFSTMPETIALIRDIMKWDPLIENEWHGYVNEMLLEPCTAPHDPAYDYDLLANNMRNLTYAAGKAVTANTGYDNFLVPWDHYDAGDWDDGGTIYSPMFAELLGCFGYTIEFPHANSDSFDAGLVIDYAQINEVLHGKTDFYAGNRLNGPLEDVNGKMRDSHEGDIIDKSMKKNAILSKLETKKRGIENVDSMEADKYFIDKKPVLDVNGNMIQIGTDRWGDPIYKKEDVVVGRARPEGKSFFPDYIVIPKGKMQYNFAEGIKAINQMLDWGIKVEVTTEDVKYDGETIPKGSYVLSMYQADRNVIFEVMSKGYDATGFADMYADIYCNLPDVRGFDSIQIYGKGLFDGKTKAQTDSIKKKADIKGSIDEYVTFKSQSTDAVRAVNYLLGKGLDVWMLRKDVDGVGNASDYIIRAKDLSKIKKIKNDEVIGQRGIQLEGKYIEDLPAETTALVEPIIQLNTERTSQTGGPLWYLLDEYLGFGSLKDYNGGASLREGANVIIANNVNASGFQDSWVDAIKGGQAGVVFIRNAAGLGKLGVKAPTSTNTFQDVAINGTYNVDDSIFTKNYADTTTYYARGFSYTDLPEGSKVLFRSLKDGKDAFIGGFQATNGEKDVFGDKITIFSTTLDGADYERPVSAVAFGQQMDYRSHYQKLLPMLATSIYASAAGIVDDIVSPTIGDMSVEENEFSFRVEDNEGGTGLAKVSVYKVKGEKESLIYESDEEEVRFTTDTDTDLVLKVVVEDKAGNIATRTFQFRADSGTVTSDAPADVALDAIRALGNAPTAETIAVAEALYNNLSDADKAKVDAALGAGGAAAAIKAAKEVVAKQNTKPTVKDNSKVKDTPKAKKDPKVEAAKAKTVKGFKAKKKGKKKVKLSWKKTAGVKTYQVQYTVAGTNKWKVLKSSVSKKKVKSKKLKKGKYQFRVCTITKVNGKNVYGKWSVSKVIKIK